MSDKRLLQDQLSNNHCVRLSPQNLAGIISNENRATLILSSRRQKSVNISYPSTHCRQVPGFPESLNCRVILVLGSSGRGRSDGFQFINAAAHYLESNSPFENQYLVADTKGSDNTSTCLPILYIRYILFDLWLLLALHPMRTSTDWLR